MTIPELNSAHFPRFWQLLCLPGMKTLIIACISCVLVPTEKAKHKNEPVFVCEACKKQFTKCSQCGNSAKQHEKLNHIPTCECGGFGRMK